MQSTSLRLAGAVFMLGAIAPASARAQFTRGVEIGMDAGLFRYSIETSSPASTVTSTVLDLPIDAIRVAFPTQGNNYEVEAAGQYSYASSSGHSSSTLAGEIGLIYELSHDARETQWFFRPAVGIQRNTASNSDSFNRTTLSAGIGLRSAIVDRISARYELRYTHWLKAHNSTANVFGLLAGLSFFTH